MAILITGIASALSALTLLVASASAQPVSVENIRVQLFYERNGELSEDITKVKDIILWNTIIGEGYAKQPAR